MFWVITNRSQFSLKVSSCYTQQGCEWLPSFPDWMEGSVYALKERNRGSQDSRERVFSRWRLQSSGDMAWHRRLIIERTREVTLIRSARYVDATPWRSFSKLVYLTIATVTCNEISMMKAFYTLPTGSPVASIDSFGHLAMCFAWCDSLRLRHEEYTLSLQIYLIYWGTYLLGWSSFETWSAK